jgi:hypothetical protein
MWDLLEQDDESDDADKITANDRELDVEGRDPWLVVRDELGPGYEVGHPPPYPYDARHQVSPVLWDPADPPPDS